MGRNHPGKDIVLLHALRRNTAGRFGCVVDVLDAQIECLAGGQAFRVGRGNSDIQVAHIVIGRRTGKRAGSGVEAQPVRQGCSIRQGHGVGKRVAIRVGEQGCR